MKKVAVVTGGAGAIGTGVAERMIADGFSVVILDRDYANAERLCEKLRGRGGEAVAVACDVTSSDEVCAAFDYTAGTFGRIDALIHCAGAENSMNWLDAPFDEWKKLFAVNCDGMFLCVQRAAREMVKNGIKGDIVVILGRDSYLQDPDSVLGHTAKWGGRGFMRNAALALAPYGIRVNGICPGTVWNESLEISCREYVASGAGTRERFVRRIEEQYPLGRIQSGEDVAEMCSFLIREGHCITGQSILIAGGGAFA
jgi:NAD(P)-dependent dehydrogenase (short-subunit alcohol dehydrogenase family)